MTKRPARGSERQGGSSGTPAHSKAGDSAMLVALTIAAGCVEAICFIGLFDTFTTFITGATIYLTVELLRADGEYVTKLVVVISFILFSAMWIATIRYLQRRPRRLRCLLSGLEATLITAFMTVAVILSPLRSADAPETTLVAFVSVIAMSLHVAQFFLLFSKLPTNFAVTGNMAKFLITVVDHLGPERQTQPPEAIEEAKYKMWIYPSAFAAFVTGVLAGAWGLSQFGFWTLLLPISILATISLTSRNRIEGGG